MRETTARFGGMDHIAAKAGSAPAAAAGAAAEHAGSMGTWLSHLKVLVKSAPVLCMTCRA